MRREDGEVQEQKREGVKAELGFAMCRFSKVGSGLLARKSWSEGRWISTAISGERACGEKSDWRVTGHMLLTW